MSYWCVFADFKTLGRFLYKEGATEFLFIYDIMTMLIFSYQICLDDKEKVSRDIYGQKMFSVLLVVLLMSISH